MSQFKIVYLLTVAIILTAEFENLGFCPTKSVSAYVTQYPGVTDEISIPKHEILREENKKYDKEEGTFSEKIVGKKRKETDQLEAQSQMDGLTIPVPPNWIPGNEYGEPLPLVPPPVPPPPPPGGQGPPLPVLVARREPHRLERLGERVSEFVTRVGHGIVRHTANAQRRLTGLNERIETGATGLQRVIHRKSTFFLAATERITNFVQRALARFRPFYEKLRNIIHNVIRTLFHRHNNKLNPGGYAGRRRRRDAKVY